jgi:hypothetical protein
MKANIVTEDNHQSRRSVIISRYRQRIAKGETIKLTRTELESLALDFINRLAVIPPNSKKQIKALCNIEIALFAEWYSLKTIIRKHLSIYCQIIAAAGEDGFLKSIASNTAINYLKYASGVSEDSHTNVYSLDTKQSKAQILLAIDAIIEWNSYQPEKFAINELLLQHATGYNIHIIASILDQQRHIIDRHHISLGLEHPFNNRGRSNKDVVDFVRGCLEGFLSLEA